QAPDGAARVGHRDQGPDVRPRGQRAGRIDRQGDHRPGGLTEAPRRRLHGAIRQDRGGCDGAEGGPSPESRVSERQTPWVGVCVGGPMDGHYYVGNSDAMVCHSTPVELVKTLPHIAMGPVTTESYRF